ncbi:MAG: energy-coupled thiamine transporter ThiT [Christensenellales bacterium]
MDTIFNKLLEVPWYTWLVLALLFGASVALIQGSKRFKWNSRRVSMAAMSLAIAFVLSCIRLFRMPQGGTITPASMLPIILFLTAYGTLPAFAVGFAYGLLQLLTDPLVIHPVQLLLDYPFAYAAMALGGLALLLPEDKKFRLPLAVLLGYFGRFVMAVLSGAIFFAEYAGEQNAWIYSVVYNISYIGWDALICALIAFVPGWNRVTDLMRDKEALPKP